MVLTNLNLEEAASTTGCEKAPLVTMKIDSLAKLLFNKSLINSPGGSLKGSPVEENINRTPIRLVVKKKGFRFSCIVETFIFLQIK